MKGIFHLIEAMKIIWEQKHKVNLILIGPDTKEFSEYFGKLSEDTRKKIIDLGITN